MCGPTARPLLFGGDYQEFNEALLEVTLPAEAQIELTMEYGGFPREDQNLSDSQGSTEISGTYLQLEMALSLMGYVECTAQNIRTDYNQMMVGRNIDNLYPESKRTERKMCLWAESISRKR